MSKKRYTAEQIISKLREAEVLLAKGVSLDRVDFGDYICDCLTSYTALLGCRLAYCVL